MQAPILSMVLLGFFPVARDVALCSKNIGHQSGLFWWDWVSNDYENIMKTCASGRNLAGVRHMMRAHLSAHRILQGSDP